MASDEARKKWGTIFMGEREASVEQLDAMQEPLRREKMRQEHTEDYMERVRKRAADRAREILGAAYTERLKVLDEARADAEASRRNAARESQKIRGEAENIKKEAAAELEKARQLRAEAEEMRGAAREEGLREGREQAADEMREFRSELGQSLARVLRALAGERQNLADAWREELCELTCAAAEAGAGYLLQKEHRAILQGLVIQALRQLEKRSTITVRVNPGDEAVVADMFAAARECVPDLRQWIVTPDESLEAGGFVAENGAGRVDCRRENFRALVDNILTHLTLPILESEEESARAMRDLVDEEAARLAAYAPEILPGEPAGAQNDIVPDTGDDGEAPAGQLPVEPGASPASEALFGYTPPDVGEEDEPAEMQEAGQPAPEEPEELPELPAEDLSEGELPLNLPPDELQADQAPEGAQGEDGSMPPAGETGAAAEETGVAAEETGDGAETPAEDAAMPKKSGQPTLAELEDELFPLEDGAQPGSGIVNEKG